MKYPGIAALILAGLLLSSCSDPDALSTAPETDAPEDSDFETAELRMGHVRMREVWVPPGYSVVDMNDRGDLLLGAAWLPAPRKRPVALPFVGRSINNHRQILGPGRAVFANNRVSQLPDPCIPFTGTLGTSDSTGVTVRDVVFDCSLAPAEVSVLAENGDALTEYRQDAAGTTLSPYRYFKVWRASTRTWQSVVEFGSSESGRVYAAISDSGLFAARVSSFPWTGSSFVSNGHGLLTDGMCSTQAPAEYNPLATPAAVNDAGEVVGTIDCQQAGVDLVNVRWSRTGEPTRLNGYAFLIDNFGNAAGIRASDGHAVIWLANGSEIDLSAAVGNQSVSVRKFLKRGQLFGFVGTHPVVWRFGFERH